MWLRYVLAYDGVGIFLYGLFFPNYSDALPTGGGHRLHDIHVLEVTHLALYGEFFVVLWKHVGRRCDFEFLSVKASHPLNIKPHQTFIANAPGAAEMICALILIDMFYSVRSKNTRP